MRIRCTHTRIKLAAKRGAIARISMRYLSVVGCDSSRNSVRRGGENFCSAQRINPATKTRKKRGARQAHSCINFHHSRCAARCSKTSASSYSQGYICPATLICQTETVRGENHYFYFRFLSSPFPVPPFPLWGNKG